MGGLMAPKPRGIIERVVAAENAKAGRPVYNVEATLKGLNAMQPGLGDAMGKNKPLALYMGEGPIQKAKDAIMDKQLLPMRQSGMPTGRVKKLIKNTNRFIGDLTPAETSRGIKTHEMSHLGRVKKHKGNPRSPFLESSKRKGGLRTVGEIVKEEGRAYRDQAFKTPGLRRRSRALLALNAPIGVLQSTRFSSTGGSIKKEISKGTLGRIAKKIMRRGK